jgi:predicted dehydrogenase
MTLAPFPSSTPFTTDSGEPALRWGVLAPGWIAEQFVTALHRDTIQHVVAVGSRSLPRAEAFAAAHGINRAVGSYEQVVGDPEVDVVYVAAPQSEHLRLGLLAIDAGKHVLIEKPITTSAAEARRLVDAARAAGVFLMEAMWSRYLPQASVIRAVLERGDLGRIVGVTADHGQAIPADPDHRLYRPELGGGALFDLGIYTVQFDSMVLGAPSSILAVGDMTDTGVDASSTLVLGHGDGVRSTLMTSIVAKTPTVASIIGTEARIDLASAFYTPTTLTMADSGHETPTVTWSDTSGRAGHGGLSWQATAMAGYIGEGRTESPLHTLAETVSIVETIETAVRQTRGVVARGPVATSRMYDGAEMR